MGLDFSKCNKFLMSFGFENSYISMCVFSNLELQNTKFDNCQVFDCDFLNSNLTKATFENSDLKDTRIQHSNLSFTSFLNAKNYNINPNENFIKKTKFSVPEVISLLSSFDIVLE